jgi:Repeat of unknown function (DUF5650)/Secretion system C-terminal sorting domain
MKKAKFTFLLLLLYTVQTQAQTITDISGPAGSGQFGQTITVLPNGNYVVTDPLYDEGAIPDVGAVYLYNGRTRNLISTLKGSTANDMIGSGGVTVVLTRGVTVLTNGNYLVHSPNWDNGSIINAGAVTWVNGRKGLSGQVSSSNSLVGITAGDQVGIEALALSNGNFVVSSPLWDNGAILNAGAVTWGNGMTGITGVINNNNSLVGNSTFDLIGGGGRVTGGNSAPRTLIALKNGNYLIFSPSWHNGIIINSVGAITWGNGATGVTGIVSSSNSLVGNSPGDLFDPRITELSNGNYVLNNRGWDNGTIRDAGAVTWCSGTVGLSGVVNSSNSLIGTSSSDFVGNGIIELSNGNYLVSSPSWKNGSLFRAGAVTWCSGITGITGEINSSNSLISSEVNNALGNSIISLSNGNYVVLNSGWDNGAIVNVGAVTWGNGITGITGLANSNNSLVGSTAGDGVGSRGIFALSNGNYIVRSPTWDNTTTVDVGAVTWCNGTSGLSGTVNSSNSLVGTQINDQVGLGGITALSNGNYVVSSPVWDNGAIPDAGAVTWGNGTTGTTGAVSSSNSLVGRIEGDRTGSNGVTALTNGNYVVSSPFWNKEVAGGNHGAVTWGNGTMGITGIVSNTNSLVGFSGQELVGNGGITALPNGNYVVVSLNYGMAPNSGAVTWGNGTTGVVGGVSNLNSLLGVRNNDQAGSGGITVLSNSNYIVSSPNWDNGWETADAGAVTWGSGTTGVFGNISSSNSLIGNSTGDQIGNGGVIALSDGNFVVKSPNFDNATTIDAGAVTLGNGAAGIDDIITRCNSVIGSAAFGGASLNFAYNDTYNYLIAGRPIDNLISTNTLRGRARPLAVTLDNSITTITGFTATQLIASGGCRIIAKLKPIGLDPIRNAVSGKVWIENIIPSHSGQPFAARHYEITPAANVSTTTGRITLYFTQTEFDNFNADPASIANLPTRENDKEGKANLRIIKYAGTSTDGSGLPVSYPGEVETINPKDDDIEWNDNQNRWEVSFNVTGFGGFIVQAAVDAITSRRQPPSENSKLALYPNPANNAATLSIDNKNLLNTMAVLTDMQGRPVKQFVISNYLEQIDLSKLAKGMYILKLADGKALKLTKN